MAVRVFQLSVVFTVGILLTSAAFSVTSLQNEINENNKTLYLKDPEDLIVAKGHFAILNCEAHSSVPGLKYSWLLNNELLYFNDTQGLLLFKNGSLNIPIFSGKRAENLEGLYRCLVSNSIGSLLSLPAKLQIANLDQTVQNFDENISVREQQPVVLPCSIHSIPNDTVIWEKDNNPLPLHTRYTFLPSGALLITSTNVFDAGSYRCKVNNKLLRKTRISKSVLLLIVQHMPTVQAPQFLNLGLSPNFTSLVGNNITLYCVASGWPIPTIQWIFNGSIVISNLSKLTLQSINIKSRGKYECIAANLAGMIQQANFLEVFQPPYFNVTPASMSFPVAKIIRLKCQALGYPEPKIEWLKNGKPLPLEPRIKITTYELILSTTYTYDAGIYQCIAVNAAGSIWSSAELTLNKWILPNPPQNVSCAPYDDTSICLQWNAPPNVSVQAYTVHIYNTALGITDGLTNVSHMLATHLNANTNYTFYVRLYSTDASDQSELVSCVTGKTGDRNLKVQKINETSVQVTWSKQSNDFPCGKTSNNVYKLEWRRSQQTSINSVNVIDGFYKIITGIAPSLTYEFRINNSNWISYMNPLNKYNIEFKIPNNNYNVTKLNENNTNPSAPYQLDAASVTSTSINLTWNDSNHFDKFYSICYFEIHNDESCKKGHFINSSSNHIEVSNLKPNTNYELKVRTNHMGVTGPWSHSFKTLTLPDVPSLVRDVRFKILNKSSACIGWKPPLQKNGKLSKYVVMYTPDINWPLEEWYFVNVPAQKKRMKTCWTADQEHVSILINKLKQEQTYTLIIRAATEAGLGNPSSPIIVTTKHVNSVDSFYEDEANSQDNEDIYKNQKIGIALGLSLAIICISFSIGCLLYQRKRLKQRTSRNNYYKQPSATAQTSPSKIPNHCTDEAHEMQHLVEEEGPKMSSSSASAVQLEPKAGYKFPTKQMNGITKHSNMEEMEVRVHITENPQYYRVSCNGHADGMKTVSTNQTLNLDAPIEDTNSNLKNTHDLKQLDEISKHKVKMNESHSCIGKDMSGVNSSPFLGVNTSLDSSLNAYLNETELSCLDDSFLVLPVVQKPLPTALSPNG